MDYNVIFHGVVTTISINPAIKLTQARFIPRGNFGTVNPRNSVTYPEIGALQIFCNLDNEPEVGRVLQGPLEAALYIAEEIMTGLVARTQEEFYLEKPIRCTYAGKMYVLESSFWHEYDPDIQTLHGGESFLDVADFIDEPKNFHPMFHFYRVAKDATYPKDYRALNLWRFFEAFYGKKGTVLRDFLAREPSLSSRRMERFYNGIRCAVAHAERLHTDPQTAEVIVPSSHETEFDGGLLVDLSKMMKFADQMVAECNPRPTDIVR